MSKNCEKSVSLNIGVSGCCEEQKKRKKLSRRLDCLVLPVCGCDTVDLLPDGGEPGDHLVKDGNNKPAWKPGNECECNPSDLLPEGGEPGEVLARDDENNPVWKPVKECGCEPSDLLPEGGEPGDVLARDDDNKPIWQAVAECGCEAAKPGFAAYKSGSDQRCAGGGAMNVIIFDHVKYDTFGNAYNSQTSRFAPGKAGRYLVNTSMLAASEDGPNVLVVGLCVNGVFSSRQHFAIQGTYGGRGVDTFALTGIVDLDTDTDYVDIRIYNSLNAGFYIYAREDSYFKACQLS